NVVELSRIAYAHSFLGNVRVLNLLTGVTEEDSWWTSDKASHTAYALGESKLSFIAFMLSRFEFTPTVPRIQVDGLLRDDFAEYYVSGQLVHVHCLNVLISVLERLCRRWTYTGIALNFFERQLVPPATVSGRQLPPSNNNDNDNSDNNLNININANGAGTWDMADNGQLAEYADLGFYASCPL
ncbi:hypothetical protein FB639_004476, partial [Coemansia asiatica]